MKTALVTGAAGGIGTAICAAFKTAGWRVVATDLAKKGPGDTYLSIDLNDVATGQAKAIASLRSAVGKKLDVLVNNAAVQHLAPTKELTGKQWDETMAINVKVAFLLTQALLKELETAKGSVVNVASIHAKLTKPGFVAYATSKAALVGLTRALAVDLGGRVRVNAVAPAAVDTPMLRAGFAKSPGLLDDLVGAHPAQRIATPADVAAVILQLAEGPPFLTGSVVDLDGAVGSRLHDPV